MEFKPDKAPGSSALCFSADGKYVYTVPWQETHDAIIEWDLSRGKERRRFISKANVVMRLATSPDGKFLFAVGSEESGLWQRWSLETGKLHLSKQADPTCTYAVVLSPDGRTLLTSSGEKAFKVWDSKTGKPLETVKAHPAVFNDLGYSADGRYVASLSMGMVFPGKAELKIWDSKTWKQVGVVHLEGLRPWPLCFTEDGKWLCVGVERSQKEGRIYCWQWPKLLKSFTRPSKDK